MIKSASIVVGVVLLAGTVLFATQNPSQPVQGPTEYFVTGEGVAAHLWVREGTTLRVVGHGQCKDCPLNKAAAEHKEGDGHDHGKK